MFGMLGCLLCITGSLTIVLHAPPERHLSSVIEVFQLAMQPGTAVATLRVGAAPRGFSVRTVQLRGRSA